MLLCWILGQLDVRHKHKQNSKLWLQYSTYVKVLFKNLKNSILTQPHGEHVFHRFNPHFCMIFLKWNVETQFGMFGSFNCVNKTQIFKKIFNLFIPPFLLILWDYLQHLFTYDQKGKHVYRGLTSGRQPGWLTIYCQPI